MAAGIEEGPARRAAGAGRQGVEAEQVTGLSIDAPGPGLVVGCHSGADRLAETQARHGVAIEPAPGEIETGRVILGADLQRVHPGSEQDRAVPACAHHGTVGIEHPRGVVVEGVVVGNGVAIQVPQAGLRDLELIARLGIGRQRACGCRGRHHGRRGNDSAPACIHAPGVGHRAIAGRAQSAQQPCAGDAEVAVQRLAQGRIPGGDEVAGGVDQLHRGTRGPLAGGQAQAVGGVGVGVGVGVGGQAPQRDGRCARCGRQGAADLGLAIEPVGLGHLACREAYRAGGAVGCRADAHDVVARSQIKTTHAGRLVGVDIAIAQRAAVGRDQLDAGLAGVDAQVLQLDPAGRSQRETQIALILARGQDGTGLGVPGQRGRTRRRQAQRGLEVNRSGRGVVLLGDEVDRAGLAGGEADRVAVSPVRPGDGATRSVHQGVAEVVGVVAGDAEVQVVGLAGHHVKAVRDQGATGGQVAADLRGAAMWDRGGLQVQQSEGIAGRAGIGLRRNIDAVGARRQAPHVVALGARQAEARFVTSWAGQTQIGGARLRIDQDGAGFGQREAVVLDVARGGDGAGNQAAQRQGGARFAVGAHGEAAGACRRVVRLAVEIEHMAPGLGERDTLRDVVTAVTAAADEGAAVGAGQAVVEVAVGVVPARIQEQALALGAIELPGSSLLPLRQREGRLGAEREAWQTRVGVGKHAPVAGAALARGQAQLVAASGEIEQSCDVAVGQVGGRQRRAHCIGAHQRRVVVVARDVQP